MKLMMKPRLRLHLLLRKKTTLLKTILQVLMTLKLRMMTKLLITQTVQIMLGTTMVKHLQPKYLILMEEMKTNR